MRRSPHRSAPFEVAIAKADAQMAVVRTDLASLRGEYRVALAEAKEAEERIDSRPGSSIASGS